MKLKLIKENTNYAKCGKEVKQILNETFSIAEEKNSAKSCQFRILENNKTRGVLRFYQKNDGSTVIDDSQIGSSNAQKKIKELLSGYLNLEAFEEGSIPLGSRNVSSDLIPIIKETLIKDFPGLKDTKRSDQVFEYRLIGNNLIVTQYKIGSILFQGRSTKFSDKVITSVDEIIADRQRDFLLSKIEEQVPKEDYELIKKALKEKKIALNDYIKPQIYSLLSGCGSYLLQDGLTILNVIKEKNIKLKDYGSILRNFSMLFEDFLVNWLINLNLINEDNLKIDPTESYIGRILQDPKKIQDSYKKCYMRKRPRFIEKLQSTYQECRHDLLHADKFKYKPTNSLVEAESKLRNIIDCMEDCIELFSEYLNMSNEMVADYKRKILGTDESGKGDYFGPLVIAGVYIEDDKMEIALRNLGVKDSKLMSDKKIEELAKKIKQLCKYTIVRIGPEKYNQLYYKMKNLNKLLGWGHARAIEDMLEIVKPDVVISDKFGDEFFIKSKLMEKGKKVNLIQEIKAEQNIAVAAASILARDTFLQSLVKLSKQYGINLPKGAGEGVLKAGRIVIRDRGNELLKKIAKDHFSITNKIIHKNFV